MAGSGEDLSRRNESAEEELEFNERPIDRESDKSIIVDVLLRPRKAFTRACQLIAFRNKSSRPRTHGRIKSAKKSNNQKTKLKNSEKPQSSRDADPSDKESGKPRSPLPESSCLADETRPGDDCCKKSAKTKTLVLNFSLDGQHSHSAAAKPQARQFVYTMGGRCLHCGSKYPQTGLADWGSGTDGVVSVSAGRVFGRAVFPSGSVLIYSSAPRCHQQLISERHGNQDGRQPTARSVTPSSRLPSLNRQPKRPAEVQRPLSGMSQSASSPLNMGPVRRIGDNRDVVTPTEFFDNDQMDSTKDEAEDLERGIEDFNVFGVAQREEGSVPQEVRERISALELEVELLKTETERQRREREKYQRLYESTALCQICMERRRNSFILPCSHFVYCGECLERHWELNNLRQCPMCRGPAHSVIITNLVC